MIKSRYIFPITAVLVVLALCFTLLFVFSPNTLGLTPQNTPAAYAQSLFKKDEVMTLDIQVDPEEWSTMLASATDKEYISCDLTVNGTTYYSVGVRPKGNSSLSMVARSDSDRYSLKFEFDHYVKGQTCLGLDKFVINNIQSDSTYMKEYLAYDILDYIGVTSPLYSFANVTVNGEDWGFFLAIEALEESFAQRNYGSTYGQLYKPETMSMGGGGMGGGEQNFGNRPNMEGSPPTTPAETQEGETTGLQPSATNGNTAERQPNRQRPATQDNDTAPSTSAQAAAPAQSTPPTQQQAGGLDNRQGFGGGRGGSGGGASLEYTDDQISSYSTIFENAVFKSSDADYRRVITALKNLNQGTALEKYVDVDQVLRYFAANTVLVNLDSYVSNMLHNYYLYENNGQISILPWDYNLAFAGFQSGSATAAVNFPIDTPVSGVELSARPLLAKLLEVEEYQNLYHQYLQEIVDGYFSSGLFEGTIDSLDALISDFVKADATAFVTYQEYEQALPVLKEFGRLRALSIQGQLAGEIPSTTQGQSENAAALIDASGISLSALGSQGGGGNQGGMGGMGNRQQPGGNTEGQNVPDNPDGQEQGGGNPGRVDGQNPDSANANGAGSQTPPDQPATNEVGGRGQNNNNNRELMMQAMQIIGQTAVADLTQEQLEQLTQLGITTEQLEQLSSFGGWANGRPQNDQPGRGSTSGNAPQTTQETGKQLLWIGIWCLPLLMALAVVWIFKRRRHCPAS